MDVKLNVTKILASGTYHRFMWIEIKGQLLCLLINDKLYTELKRQGVPTSQSLRKKVK